MKVYSKAFRDKAGKIPFKDGKIHFYAGSKKADAKAIKQFIKLNHAIIDGKKLDAKQRQYLGQVKGGKNKAANTLVNSKGQFLPKNLQDKALKNLGIDIEKLREAKQVKTIRDIFKDNKELQKSFDNLIENTGLPFWYNPDKFLDKLSGYNGKHIFIVYCDSETDAGDFYSLIKGAKEVPKANALYEFNKYVKKLKRLYDFFDMSIMHLLVGVDKFYFGLDKNVTRTGEDSYITFPTDQGEASIIQLYHSSKK